MKENLLDRIKQTYPHYNDKQIVTMAMHLDIMFFAKICSKDAMFNKSAPFHYEIADVLQNNAVKRANIMSFRGSAKSTLCSFILPLWKILTKSADEPVYILIISESQDQSKNFLQRIKDELSENVKIHDYFGDFSEKTAKRWQMDDIILKNGARIKALGTGQKPRGVIQRHSRPTLIVIDDFESESNAPTPERRTGNRKWVTEAVIPTLTPDGRIIMVGTVISDDCFLLWAKEAHSWQTLEYTILDDNGCPTWEDRFPLTKIESIRQEYEDFGNLGGFYQEYMNKPQAPEDAPFKENWFKYHDFELIRLNNLNYLSKKTNDTEILIPCYVVAGVDLASSLGDKNDFTVFATIAYTKERKAYIIDITSMKSDPAYHPDRFVEYFLKYRQDNVAIETVSYQETMRSSVKRICEEKNLWIPGIESGLKERTSKSERIMSLVPFIAHGDMFFKRNMITTINQFLSFPKGKHDDEIDAIWNAMSRVKKPYHTSDEAKTINKKKKKKVLDWMTL